MGLHFVPYNKGWNLAVGDSYRSRVVIDKHRFGMVDATTPTKNGIDFLIGNDGPSMESIQAGRRITFTTRDGKKSFKLQGTRRAVDKLLDCANKYLTATQDRSPTTDPFIAGVAADESKDFTGAFGLWLPLAENGDAKVQNLLGILYYNGQKRNRHIASGDKVLS